MIVDVAHTGHQTAMDTIEASLSPVVISHGNVMALGNHPRCVGDDMISAIAANRGVIGITGLGLFLGKAGATVENYVAHIDHIVQLTGPEHVGIGLDYIYDIDSLLKFAEKHPAQYPPEGGYLDDLQQIEHAQLPAVTDALLNRGYSDDSVKNILGGNWLRLIEEVWR